MGRVLSTYAVSVITFLAFDAVWLGVVAKNLYRNNIGHLLADSPNWLAAAIFYPLYVVGIVAFVIWPALQSDTPLVKAMLWGALFGIMCYATYDLTNQATAKDWPWMITIIDLAWGAFVTGMTTLISLAILRWVN